MTLHLRQLDARTAQLVAAFAILGVALFRIVIDGLSPDALALMTPAIALLTINTKTNDKEGS